MISVRNKSHSSQRPSMVSKTTQWLTVTALATLIMPCPALLGQSTSPETDQSNPRVGSGIHRLLQRSDVANQYRLEDESLAQQPKPRKPQASGAIEASFLIPSGSRSKGSVKSASFTQENGLQRPAGFLDRDTITPGQVMPLPVGRIERARAASPNLPPQQPQFDRNATQEEYIFDGSDRGVRTTVDGSWNVYGLDTEDTVGHFDTLDGQRIVTPSNRVAIYAPRFASVRKVEGAYGATLHLAPNAMGEKMQTVFSADTAGSSTTKQHLAPNRHKGSDRASGLVEETKGALAKTSINLFGFRNVFEPYANTGIIRNGKYHRSQGTLLAQGIQSAVAWEVDTGLKVLAQGIQPIIVRDIGRFDEIVKIESEDGTAILRVVKVADKMAARTGEEVEFTIRFDNISKRPIGNVTLMDNLTRRLKFVEGSDECSVAAEFINERNDSDSLMLRWEVTEPLEPGTGGIIRFRCRVQ